MQMRPKLSSSSGLFLWSISQASTWVNCLWQGKTGLIPDIVVQDYQDLSNCHVYAAGHPEMVLSALEKLGALGLPKENLFPDSLF